MSVRDRAAVGHLAAALGVERAVLQLGEQGAVLRLHRAHHRVGRRGLVADEAGREAGLAREAPPRDRPPARRRGPCAAARAASRAPSISFAKPCVVDRQALLGEHLLGHLEREAVGVVQPEGVLGGHL